MFFIYLFNLSIVYPSTHSIRYEFPWQMFLSVTSFLTEHIIDVCISNGLLNIINAPCNNRKIRPSPVNLLCVCACVTLMAMPKYVAFQVKIYFFYIAGYNTGQFYSMLWIAFTLKVLRPLIVVEYIMKAMVPPSPK